MSNEDRMARAGDYVLGLMDEHDRARAERDLEVDAEFRDCVLRFAEQMHAFDRGVAPAAVPDSLWDEVAKRIADMPQMAMEDIPASRPAAEDASPDRLARRGIRGTTAPRAHQIGGWRGALMAASLLLAVGIGYWGGQVLTSARQPIVVVVLNDANDMPGAIVEAYGDDQVRIVPLTAFDVPAGKTLEVWTLYDREVGPVSLGTFAKATEILLRGPDLPVPQPEQLYEITLEDAPGSPVGRPTGPILVKGLAVRPPR